MAQRIQIAVVSDIHYASTAEQARGDDYEYRELSPITRIVLRRFRHHVWNRDPLRKNHLFEKFLEQAGTPDLVIANGDYCVDTAFVGLSDDAAKQSAKECLDRLRGRFGAKFHACFGDHELGKMSLIGRRGGLRIASWRKATEEIGLAPVWRVELGNYVLLGVASPLLAFPVYEPESLAGERSEWRELRAAHLAEIRRLFGELGTQQRVILFCHDPSALPYLAEEEAVKSKLAQVEMTVIGHLHSKSILHLSRVLSGMPTIRFLGHTVRRLTAALSRARAWKQFRVRLCPALTGIELLKDGGWLRMEIDPSGAQKLRFDVQKLH